MPPRIYSGSLTEYGPRALLYLALKLLGLVSMITILYMSEVLIHNLRSVQTLHYKNTCSAWSCDRFSLKKYSLRGRGRHCSSRPTTTYASGGRAGGVDRYSVAWGVTFGAGLVALQRIDHIPGTAFSSLLALVALTAYTTFTILCHSVSECEEIHSYVAFIPVTICIRAVRLLE